MRFHIIEAKKLVGGNLQPLVKVICGKDVETTSTQKGSNNPFWDEMVYFNFKVLPKEMLDKVCDIKVCAILYVSSAMMEFNVFKNTFIAFKMKEVLQMVDG